MRAALVTLITACLLIPAVAAAQNSPPVADAGEAQTALPDEIVQLEGSAVDPDGDTIVSWIWTIESKPGGSNPTLDFADTAYPLFSASVKGEYMLSLVVGDGTDYSVPDTVVVTVVENHPPVVIVTVEPTSGYAPLNVDFDASESYDPDVQQFQYFWDFDDGATSTKAVVSHLFIGSGTYYVILTLTDLAGAESKETIQIDVLEVNNPPSASPTATPASGRVPLTVDFIANTFDSDGDALTYAWDFGDGETSTNENPSHTYVLEDIYAVSLVVDDGTDTATNDLTIVVGPPLTINAGDPDFGLGPDGFGVPVSGPSNIPVTIIIKTNLLDSPWSPLHACDLTNGAILFTDPGWTNRPASFYRVRTP